MAACTHSPADALQALEEEAELRQATRMNNLMMEVQKLGGQVDEALEL